jgi:hypothetical protein
VLRARRFYEVAALSAVRKTPAGLAPAGVETIAFKAMEEDAKQRSGGDQRRADFKLTLGLRFEMT